MATDFKDLHMPHDDHAPMVTFNRIDKTAYFIFRRRRYDLPGKFKTLAEAQYVAQRQCRLMGWKG